MKNKKTIIIIAVAVIVVALIVAAVLIIMNTNKRFTVKFNTQGGNEIPEIKVKKNETLVLPKDPVKEGFVFLYWEDENHNPVLSNFVVTKDSTLTATWSEEDAELLTVTFDTDGGSIINEMSVVKGEKINFPENPTKSGFKFIAWVDSQGTQFDEETIIEEDIILKATWEKEEEKKEEKKVEKKEEKKVEKQEEQKEEKKVEQKEETKPVENKNIEATGISLNKSTVELIIGNTGSLTATVTPDNASNKAVTWSSSDSSIISVDNSGNLKANALGQATITAKTANGKTATATVYSDVESIKLTASKTYISKYGGTNSSSLSVTVTPSVASSLIKWSAPDATGANAAASFSGSGTSATITARDAWGSYFTSIPVTVSVGRKTSNKVTIYVEPKLNDLTFKSGSTIVNRGVYVEIQASVPVDSWTFNSESFATGIKKTDRTVSFTSKNDRMHQEGFVITARTKAGQSKSVSISVNAK